MQDCGFRRTGTMSFSVTVIECLYKTLLREERFILLYVARGNSASWLRRQGWQQQQEAALKVTDQGHTWPFIYTQEVEKEQEVKPGYKTLKPTSTDSLPPARLSLLKFHNFTKQCHRLGAKRSIPELLATFLIQITIQQKSYYLACPKTGVSSLHNESSNKNTSKQFRSA